MPLSFEANRGQTDVPVQFLSRGKAIASASSAASPSGLNFAPPVLYDATGYQTFSLAVADLNGDGKLDLVVASLSTCDLNCTSGSVGIVAVLLGNGDGTFRTAVTYASGGLGAYSVAVADVNGDGKPDIVVANESSIDGESAGAVGILL